MIWELLLWLFVTIILGVVACFMGKRFGVSYLIAMFTGAIMVTSVVAGKLIQVGPFTSNAGLVVYSITFLLTDTIGEFWGKEEAKKAVWSGFLGLILFVFVTQISIQLTPASFWEGQEAFKAVLSSMWRISLASFVAFVVAQFHDVWAYHYLKKKTNNRFLWLRNNLSTAVSQTIDTVLFMTIAFAGIAPLWPLIWGTILLKIAVAILDTPFLYLIRWYYKNVKPHWRKRVFA